MKPDTATFIEILCDAMEWEDVEVGMDTPFKTLPEWDSLSFLSLLTVLRSEYGISLDVQSFNNIESFQDIYSLIEG